MGTVRTQHVVMAFRDVETPLTQIVVHLHRKECETLVEVEVYCVDGVEIRVIVDDMAPGLCNPIMSVSIVLQEHRRRAHCMILWENAAPGRRPKSIVNESWRSSDV